MNDGHAVTVIAAHPEVGDRREDDDEPRYLGDAQAERARRQPARPRHAGDEERKTDQDGLDEGDSDDPLGTGPDRGRGEPREALASLGADDARKDRSTGTCARLAVR